MFLFLSASFSSIHAQPIIIVMGGQATDSIWNNIREISEDGNEIFVVDIEEEAETNETNEAITSKDVEEIATTENNNELDITNIGEDYEIVASNDPVFEDNLEMFDSNEKVEDGEEKDTVE